MQICHLLDITAVAGHLAWLAVLFHDFIHVHSPWARADNPLGPKFWCQQEGLITMVICCKFKKNLFNLWLYTHLLYRRWSGADNPRGQNFNVNRNLLSLWSFATSFKQISLKSDFIPFFFHDFIHEYSPGAGLTIPCGWNFDVNRNILSLRSLLQVSKKYLLHVKSDFIQFCSWFYTCI